MKSTNNPYEILQDQINGLKEINQAAGDLLHDQLHHAANAQWDSADLANLLKSEEDAVDLLDQELSCYDELAMDIRNIQDSILNMFGVTEYV